MTIERGRLHPREPALDLVRVISEGTYTSFPQAVKEFVSNAYDADAFRVDISFDDDCRVLAIKDDGVGMTLDEFRDYFASIARTGRSAGRSPRSKTRLGRLRIGRFGIGALAVAGLATRFVVRSSRRGSSEGFEASLDLGEIQTRFGRGEDLSQHWVFDFQRWHGERMSAHFTEVRVEELRDEIREVLLRPGERELDEFIESAGQLSGENEFLWELGSYARLPMKSPIHLRRLVSTRRRTESLRGTLDDFFGIGSRCLSTGGAWGGGSSCHATVQLTGQRVARGGSSVHCSRGVESGGMCTASKQARARTSRARAISSFRLASCSHGNSEAFLCVFVGSRLDGIVP